MEDRSILDITESVQWIGVLDPDIRTFDIVMETRYGTTYNSYFIEAQKKTVVETVKEKFWGAYLQKLEKTVDPGQIDYIVVHHTEPDHSGALAHLLAIAPKAKVVGSANAVRYLRDQLGCEFPHLTVKDGQVLDLGNKKLRFLNAPNLHWPDSLFSYLEEDKLLFTCDVFGEHFCHPAMFDDLVGDFEEAFRYYFEVILRPFSKFLLQALDKARPLEIKTVCPGHGVILRENWKKYFTLTESMARESLTNPAPKRVLIAYVSAYQYTAQIALLIAQGLRQAGVTETDLCDIEKMPLPIVERKLMESAALLLGSPTLNQNIVLPIYGLLAMINPLRDKGKPAAAFGSFGWSGEGVKIITAALNQLKLQVYDEGLAVRFRPHGAIRDQCIAYGKAFGERFLSGATVHAG